MEGPDGGTGSALFAELGVFYFQHVDDAGERGQPLLELVVLAAQIGEFVAEQVVVDLQAVGDLRGGGPGI